jgi:hypothetical protein
MYTVFFSPQKLRYQSPVLDIVVLVIFLYGINTYNGNKHVYVVHCIFDLILGSLHI